MVDLTAVAAFTAAALSLVNVIFSYRLTSRGQREQWRREQERPIVASILTLSYDARRKWEDAAVANAGRRGAWGGSAAEGHWKEGSQLLKRLRYEVTQLDLLATGPVRDMAGKLHLAHGHEESRLLHVEAQGQQDVEARVASQKIIRDLEIELAERTREDLGLNRIFRKRASARDRHGTGERPTE